MHKLQFDVSVFWRGAESVEGEEAESAVAGWRTAVAAGAVVPRRRT